MSQLLKMHRSNHFRDFLAICLQKEPESRPDASELLLHPFVSPINKGEVLITDLIEQARDAKRARGLSNPPNPDHDEGDDDEENDDSSAVDEDSSSSATLKAVAKGTIVRPGSAISAASDDSSPIRADLAALRLNTSSTEMTPPSRPDSRLVAASSPVTTQEDDIRTPVSNAHKNVFKAVRLCRLARKINCADFTAETLLLGVDDGLYAFETVGTSVTH
jgi:serine/threonine protein kinase